MSLPVVEFRYSGQVHSPFSGQPAEVNDKGANEADPTLLFVYYGMAAGWSYVSPRLPAEVTRFVDNIEPEDLAESLDVEGAVVFVVDADWNGVNYYGFAPADSEIKFPNGVAFAGAGE